MHTPPPPNPSPSSQYLALLPPSTMAAPLKPWRTEYAKSNRSTCKSCSSLISKDTLRIAKVVAATQFDGIMPIWYHAKCVLKKPGQIRTLNDVEGIDALRWEDQQKLRNYVDGGSSFANEGQINEAESTRGGVDGDYAIENAKSSRAGCKSCNEKIEKGQVRISTLVESGSYKFRGKVPAWRHAKCFLELGWWVRPLEDMPGWEDLSTEDQQAIKELAEPFIKGSQNKGSKRKVEETLSGPSEKIAHGKTGPAGDQKSRKRKKGENEIVADRGELVEKDVANKGKRIQKGQEKSKAEANPGITDKMAKEFEKKLEKQSKALWEIKDNLRKHVETTELRRMLEVNAQDSSGSEYDLRDRCADGMMFGTLGKCPMCDGPIEYHGGQYRCRGNISEWTKCSFTTTLPERLKAKWKIPDETENDYLRKWFKSQASKKETRLLLPQSPGKPTAKQEETAKKKLDLLKNAASGPLGGMTVTIVGKLEKSLAKWKQLIVAAGGRLLTEITSETNYVITSETELELEESRSKLQHAQNLKIHIVREAFLTDCIEGGVQLPVDQYVIETAGKLASIVKVKVKGRSAVHEETGLQDSGHILEDGRTIYTTTLNLSDLSTGINSYYIMQIIEDDKKKLYHLFRKWGRVGNSKIGSSKLDQYSKSSAINEFKRLFREKTGNDWESWENKQNFKKQPNKFYPLEIDYGVDDKTPRNVKILGSKSKLDPRVISLMKMLFDLETYKAAMMEFEINMSEMPLGKLSKRNIEQGFQVLTEIQNIICSNESRHGIKESSLIDASNRFFTLIPHVHPQAIRDEEVLKSKIQMLEALRDIEIASKLIGSVGEDTEEDPLDTNYKKLCCAILPLPHDSSDFQMVQAYLERTHAPTHTEWSLELEDVFAVDREKEYEAYAPVKEKLSNRMLLWHGSRTTNFVGILSQGLRIAPPEAPVTGYMFGKGVYFADLVSKSAQYCYTTKKNPTGLMLLSEVALGETYELKKAKYIEKPPSGKHSTKGLGKNKPLESEYQVWGDQVTVPCGRPVSSGLRDTELQYNEYIVYDTAQIKLQFLLKVRFKHKR